MMEFSRLQKPGTAGTLVKVRPHSHHKETHEYKIRDVRP